MRRGGRGGRGVAWGACGETEAGTTASRRRRRRPRGAAGGPAFFGLASGLGASGLGASGLGAPDLSPLAPPVAASLPAETPRSHSLMMPPPSADESRMLPACAREKVRAALGRGGGRAEGRRRRPGGAHLELALRARLAGESPPGGLKVGAVGESPPRGRIACCGMRARLLLQTSARAAPRSSTCRRRRRALKDERCAREGCRAPRAQQRARALRTHREALEACRGLRPPSSAATALRALERRGRG